MSANNFIKLQLIVKSKMINRFTLKFQNPQMEQQYRLFHYGLQKKIFAFLLLSLSIIGLVNALMEAIRHQFETCFVYSVTISSLGILFLILLYKVPRLFCFIDYTYKLITFMFLLSLIYDPYTHMLENFTAQDQFFLGIGI